MQPRLVTRDGERQLDWPTPIAADGRARQASARHVAQGKGAARKVTVPLSTLAHARSGDKGDTCNIGVIARAPEIYPWLRQALTATVVKRRFKGICRGAVERFEVPNLWALNFLLHESLGGGGTVSLRLDAQGKTLSHALLAMPVTVPQALVDIAARADAGGAAKPARAKSTKPARRR